MALVFLAILVALGSIACIGLGHRLPMARALLLADLTLLTAFVLALGVIL